MLQRAATNAYSWWWASHIRTKQSKWLEQSMADMDEKVHATLQIIDHDGDSFARRAEMYYKRRPEIIGFVEEAFRAYRALAERYDHLSRDLQSANRTIAQVFPERVQFSLDEDDEQSPEAAPSSPRLTSTRSANIPKAPKAPAKLLASTSMARIGGQKQLKKNASSARDATSQGSGLKKHEALEEIDRLQKGILGLQTEKEFVRSLYEHTTNKYWDIENQIAKMQDTVYSLQDEFGIGATIEVTEARALMAETAIKSCQQSLTKLKGKQQQSVEDAKAEYERIEEAHHRLEAMRDEYLARYEDDEHDEPSEKAESTRSGLSQLVTEPTQEKQELEILREMIRENLATGMNKDLSVIGLAENIDELVSKVVRLETEVTTQNALVKRLTSETDELHAHVRKLEGDKPSLIHNSETMKRRLNLLAKELRRVVNLKQIVMDQNTNLLKYMTEASCNVEHMSEKMGVVKLDEDLENEGLFREVKEAPDERAAKMQKMKSLAAKLISSDKPKKKDDVSEESTVRTQEIDLSSDEHGEERTEDEEHQPSWNMYLNTLDDRERMLLEEYTTVLKNYKDVRRKLSEAEKRNKDNLYGLSTKVRDLVKTNTMREAEIQALLQQLNIQQAKPQENSPAVSSYRDPAVHPGSEKNSTTTQHRLSTVSSSSSSQDLAVHPGSEKYVSTTQDHLSTTASSTQDPAVHSGSKKDASAAQDHLSTAALSSQDPTVHSGSIKDASTTQDHLSTTALSSQDPTVHSGNEKDASATRDNPSTTAASSQDPTVHSGSEKDASTTQVNSSTAASSFQDPAVHSGSEKDAGTTQVNSSTTASSFQDPAVHSGSEKDTITTGVNDMLIVSGSLTDTPAYERGNVSKVSRMDECSISTIEEQIRMDIDELLEENLGFWLRWSNSIIQRQKFQNTIQDLKTELAALENKLKEEGNDKTSLSSEAKPIYRHLREIQTELKLWEEQSAILKDEMLTRFSTLSRIQDVISGACSGSSEVEDAEVELTDHQAAKYHGEVINMTHEYIKVETELEKGFERVRTLQFEVDILLEKLGDDFGVSTPRGGTAPQVGYPPNRAKIPLSAFLFGVKMRKHKNRNCLFACVSPSLQRQYSDLGSPTYYYRSY